jgi:adenosylcobinamide kinase/adenosylcobinamide-phosphate guanylyltransferase
MAVLVTGGVRSGKSRHAESLLAAQDVTYITPGYPADGTSDAEWSARVAAHRLRRPASWRTVETVDIASAIAAAPGPVLVDCLGTWLTRLIDDWEAWDEADAAIAVRLQPEVDALVRAVSQHPGALVLVTNEVGWGVVSEHRAGRIFADHLGRINQQVAAACDTVVLMVAGRPLSI